MTVYNATHETPGSSEISAYFDLRLQLADLYPLPPDWLQVTKDAGIVAGAINLQGAALTVWFNILDYALTNKLSQALMTAVVAQNPQCAARFKAYLDELAAGQKPTADLPGLTTDDRVNTALAGFNAVNQQSKDIQATLAADNGLTNVTSQIDVLKTYKDLHDHLQSFQYGIGSFQNLLVAARDMGADLEQVRVMRNFLKILKLFCVSIGESVMELPAGPALHDIEQAWLDDLKAAAIKLQAAIDNKSPDAYDALFDVRTVLRVVPSRLNQQIFVTAKNLPFGLLATGLDTIAGKLPAEEPSVPLIKAAHDAIMVLSSTIYARVVEHKLWQDIDNKLASLTDMIEPIEGGAAADKSLPFQFSPLWRNLEVKVKVLADLDPTGAWRATLVDYSTDVNDQLSRETVDTAFILAFEAYRDEAQQRFVQVDLALKTECASIVRVSTPLHKIIEDLGP
ncbi:MULTISPECIES: hypothetical protein [unclassified Mesorhizobium]|uniref:hypothetical protein n=1 Tax=unclassified Mesorhizobium TaxID=325217 RepID=UPI0012DC0C93|nr:MULTISPECIES: hypothetical protein [unclassified Mesorhizobium]